MQSENKQMMIGTHKIHNMMIIPGVRTLVDLHTAVEICRVQSEKEI